MIKLQIGNKEGTNLKDLNMGVIHDYDGKATEEARRGAYYGRIQDFLRYSHDFTIGTNILDLGIFTSAGSTAYIWQNGKLTGLQLVLQNKKTSGDYETHTFVLRNTKFNQGIVMCTTEDAGLYLMLNPLYYKNIGSNPSWQQCVVYSTTLCGGCNETTLSITDNCFFCGWKKCVGKNALNENQMDPGFNNSQYLMSCSGYGYSLSNKDMWGDNDGRARTSFLNLENPYLWYQFITNELYIKTASTIALFNEDEDPIIMAQNAYGDYWIAGQESTSSNAYDTSMFAYYQLGTDLSQYLQAENDKITLFNGSVIEHYKQDGDDFIRLRDLSGTYYMICRIAPFNGICLKKWDLNKDPYIQYDSSYTGIYLTKTPGTSGGLKNWINSRDETDDFQKWLTASCLICETTYNAAHGNFIWPSYTTAHDKHPGIEYKSLFDGKRFNYGCFMIHNGRQINDRIAYDYGYLESDNTMKTAEAWRVLLGISKYIDKTNPTGNPDAIGGGNTGGGLNTGSGKGDFTNTNNKVVSNIPSSGAEALGNLFQMAVITNENLNKVGNAMDKDTRLNIIDSIVSLKKVYVPEIINTSNGITLQLGGKQLNGVIVNPITNQYQEVDFGSIAINEYYGSFLDYAPYTKIKIFLPFSGFYDINTDNVMDGTIHLKCNIDIMSATCMWIISVTGKGGLNSVLYQYPGNIGGDIPITATDYSGRITTTINTAVRVAGDLIAKDYVGAATSAVGGITEIAMSKPSKGNGGGTTGSLGAMSPNVPYLIIERPVANIPDNYGDTVGYCSDASLILGEATGYMKIKDVHLENMGYATADEIAEIESLLKEGVVF